MHMRLQQTVRGYVKQVNLIKVLIEKEPNRLLTSNCCRPCCCCCCKQQQSSLKLCIRQHQDVGYRLRNVQPSTKNGRKKKVLRQRAKTDPVDAHLQKQFLLYGVTKKLLFNGIFSAHRLRSHALRTVTVKTTNFARCPQNIPLAKTKMGIKTLHSTTVTTPTRNNAQTSKQLWVAT